MLTGCVSPEEKREAELSKMHQQEMANLQANSRSMSVGQFYRSEYNLRVKYQRLADAYEEAFWRKVFVAADEFDQHKINQTKFDAIYAQLAVDLHERQERDAARYMPVEVDLLN
jgi:hypothetical protein